MPPVTRYHPALVALHWLIAVLILVMLGVGFFMLAATPNTDPGKIDVLRIHMATGMFILVLMAVRLVVRLRTAKPPRADSGNRLLDRLAAWLHYGFYAVVVAMIAAGWLTGIFAGLPDIVFGNSGAPLPADFDIYPTFQAHELLAYVLLGMMGLHVGAAVWHQFVRKDGLIGRMLFGRRTS